ncbi:MAG: tyrosine-type recombinase/integrase [Treponema sp.]|nr:tyrosine-type recombinase/integrase [Treponema sp.]
MGTTQPIRDKEMIDRIKGYLLKKNHRDYLLFIICINTALRISDILKLKWNDVYDFNAETVKKHIIVHEKKTKKKNIVASNTSVVKAIESYLKSTEIKNNDYVFISRKGNNSPISRYRAYTIFRDAANKLGIEKFSCHSLRKTFGYHAWKQNVSSVLLLEIYNHSSFSVTKKYLGIMQEDKDAVYYVNIL